METTDLKEHLQDLKSIVKDTIKSAKGKTKWLEVTERNVAELFDRLDDVDGVDTLDEDHIKGEIRSRLFERILVEAENYIDDLVDDLNNHLHNMDEDETGYSYFSEKLESLENWQPKLSQESWQYEELTDLIESLEEIYDSLNQM